MEAQGSSGKRSRKIIHAPSHASMHGLLVRLSIFEYHVLSRFALFLGTAWCPEHEEGLLVSPLCTGVHVHWYWLVALLWHVDTITPTPIIDRSYGTIDRESVAQSTSTKLLYFQMNKMTCS